MSTNKKNKKNLETKRTPLSELLKGRSKNTTAEKLGTVSVFFTAKTPVKEDDSAAAMARYLNMRKGK